MSEVTNNDDVIDSRDVIARIEELSTAGECEACGGDGVVNAGDDCPTCEGSGEVPTTDPDELEELRVLRELASEGEGFSDWEYGAAMIRDSYFADYARELASDLGYMDREGADQWPFTCIDWERAARELQTDYSIITFDGVDYWIR